MKNFLKPEKLGILSLGIVALLSIISFPKILAQTCQFQTNWFLCAETLSPALKVLNIILVVAFFGALIYWAWQSFKISEVISVKKILFVLLLAILIEPVGSGDIGYYFGAGRALQNGHNVYAVSWQTRNFTGGYGDNNGLQYGPITASMFRVVYQFSGDNLVVFSLLWKIFNAVVLLSCAYVIWLIIKQFKAEQKAGPVFALILFQPLVLFEVIGNGHFDIWWLLCIFGSIFFALKKQWWLVFPVLTVGIWVKFVPIFFVPFFLLWWWQEINFKNWKKYCVELVSGVLISFTITLLFWHGYWVGMKVFGSLILQSKWAVTSVFSVIYYSLLPLATLLLGAGAHWWLTRLVQGSLFLAVIYLLWPIIVSIIKIIFKKEVWSGQQYIQGIFFLISVYLLIWQKSIWPWYFVWPLMIGLILYLIDESKYLKKILVWMASAPLVFYPVWFTNFQLRGADAAGEYWFFVVMGTLLAVYPIFLLYEWRKIGYTFSLK